MYNHTIELGKQYSVKEQFGEVILEDAIRSSVSVPKEELEPYEVNPILTRGSSTPSVWIGKQSILKLDYYAEDENKSNLEFVVDPCFKDDMGEPTIREKANEPGYLYRLSVKHEENIYVSDSEIFPPNQKGMVEVHFKDWRNQEGEDTPLKINAEQLHLLEFCLDYVELNK